MGTIGARAGRVGEGTALALMTGAIALASLAAKSSGEGLFAGTPENEFLLARPVSLARLVAARGLAALLTDPFGTLFLLPVMLAAALAWQLPPGAALVGRRDVAAGAARDLGAGADDPDRRRSLGAAPAPHGRVHGPAAAGGGDPGSRVDQRHGRPARAGAVCAARRRSSALGGLGVAGRPAGGTAGRLSRGWRAGGVRRAGAAGPGHRGRTGGGAGDRAAGGSARLGRGGRALERQRDLGAPGTTAYARPPRVAVAGPRSPPPGGAGGAARAAARGAMAGGRGLVVRHGHARPRGHGDVLDHRLPGSAGSARAHAARTARLLDPAVTAALRRAGDARQGAGLDAGRRGGRR